MKVFVFDAAKCNGCYCCQLACKDEHCGNNWLPYAAPQPDTGHFWLKLEERTHGQVPKVRVGYRPVLCMHCDDPACRKAAPDCVYKREDGLVILDPEKAAGRKELAESCPYGAICWNEELSLPQKCTGCAHLVEEGKLPHCVDLCATGALRFGEEEEFGEMLQQAEVLHPEWGLGPRVYYLNLPKLFLAGEVWNPAEDEVIEGAKLSLVCEESGQVWETSSDEFGDFWFRRLNPGRYVLKIRADGFFDVEKEIVLEESLNVGDFSLLRA